MDFLLNHVFEVVQLSINTLLFLVAIAKKADKALLGYIKHELRKEFLTRSDGTRIERKLDAVLSRYRRMRLNAPERRTSQNIAD